VSSATVVAAGAGAVAFVGAAVADAKASVAVEAGVASEAAAAVAVAGTAGTLPTVWRDLGIPNKVFQVWIASCNSLGSTIHTLLHSKKYHETACTYLSKENTSVCLTRARLHSSYRAFTLSPTPLSIERSVRARTMLRLIRQDQYFLMKNSVISRTG
jgi:hypothetical protein